MNFLKKIPPNLFLLFSLILITIAIGILFLGKYIFAIFFSILGIIFLIAWTFYGLFEDSTN